MKTRRLLPGAIVLAVLASCGSTYGDATELPVDGTSGIAGRLTTAGDLALTRCCVNIYPFDEDDEWETDEFGIERRLSVGVRVGSGNTYSFEKLRAGRYRLELTWDLYPTTSEQFASGMIVDRKRGRSIQLGPVTLVEGSMGQHDIDLGDRSPGQLEVTVRVDGRLATDGMVDAFEPEFCETVDHDGVARFQLLPPGDYALAARGNSPGGQRLPSRVVVRPGETTRLDCDLHVATHTLRVTEAQTQKPLPGLRLALVGRNVPRAFRIGDLETDESGELRLTTYPGEFDVYSLPFVYAVERGDPRVLATIDWADSAPSTIDVPLVEPVH